MSHGCSLDIDSPHQLYLQNSVSQRLEPTSAFTTAAALTCLPGVLSSTLQSLFPNTLSDSRPQQAAGAPEARLWLVYLGFWLPLLLCDAIPGGDADVYLPKKGNQ